jgi:GINS complex subunit 4
LLKAGVEEVADIENVN